MRLLPRGCRSGADFESPFATLNAMTKTDPKSFIAAIERRLERDKLLILRQQHVIESLQRRGCATQSADRVLDVLRQSLELERELLSVVQRGAQADSARELLLDLQAPDEGLLEFPTQLDFMPEITR